MRTGLSLTFDSKFLGKQGWARLCSSFLPRLTAWVEGAQQKELGGCVREKRRAVSGPGRSQQRLVWNVFFLTSWNLQVFRQAAVAIPEAGLEGGCICSSGLLMWNRYGQSVKGHLGGMPTKRSHTGPCGDRAQCKW